MYSQGRHKQHHRKIEHIANLKLLVTICIIDRFYKDQELVQSTVTIFKRQGSIVQVRHSYLHQLRVRWHVQLLH